MFTKTRKFIRTIKKAVIIIDTIIAALKATSSIIQDKEIHTLVELAVLKARDASEEEVKVMRKSTEDFRRMKRAEVRLKNFKERKAMRETKPICKRPNFNTSKPHKKIID